MKNKTLGVKELKIKLTELIKPKAESLNNLDSAWDFAYDFNELTLPLKPENMSMEEFKTIAYNIFKEF